MATPHHAARAVCEQILRQTKAQFYRNTGRISKNCNAWMAQNFHKAPPMHVCGVAL